MKARPLKSRFAKPCSEIPTTLDSFQQDMAATYMGEKPRGDCHIELFLGFFFDGTRNNMYLSQEADDDSETNIARLWSVFDDSIEPSYSPGRSHRFRSYVEGVGTRCMSKIGDPGIGAHAAAGASAAWGGEGRINWALLEFQNNLYSHFMGSRSFTVDLGQDTILQVKRMSSDMSMSRFQVRQLAKAARMSMAQYRTIKPGSPEDIALRGELTTYGNLGGVAAEHLAAPNDEMRIAVLRDRNKALAERLKGFLSTSPKLARIRISIFGFSRGAAEARVFANWLADACDPPAPSVPSKEIDPRGQASGLRLCGIPVEIDFMGLFDTVASVGAAPGFLPTVFDGHGGWCRQQDLAIPAYVRRCVHMVGAHEVRGSFPLDLIDGAGHEEIVYPGVHSDVGGGYRRGEQGRMDSDGSKLSQIALCDMYREAVAAGVPLRLDKFPSMQSKFAVSASLRKAFNSYIEATANISALATGTRALIHAHYGLYLRWRRLRARPGPAWVGDTASAQRARRGYPQDYMDLVTANSELLMELEEMDATDGLTQPIPSNAWPWSHLGPTGYIDAFQQAMRLVRGPKREMWHRELRAIWNMHEPLAPAIIELYDDYIHDSRAGFKPLGDDDDVWFAKQRRRMQVLASRESARQRAGGQTSADSQRPDLTDQEREELARWRADPQDLPLQTSGREYFWMWGYLRWRTLYPNPLQNALLLRKQDAAKRARLRRDNTGVLEVLEEFPGLAI